MRVSADVYHDGLDHDKVDIRALGSSISLYQNESSMVLRNIMKISVFFLRGYETLKISIFFYIRAMTWLQLVFDNPNWYLVSFTLLSTDG